MTGQTPFVPDAMPDDAYIRMGILAVDPLIVLGTLDHSYSGMNFSHSKARAAFGERPVHMLTVLPWSHEDPGAVARVAEILLAQQKDFPDQTVYVMGNTIREVELFRASGIRAGLFNHNIFIDQTIFRPMAGVEREFDTVYVAAMQKFKRHDLMSRVDSGVLAYARWQVTPENDAYYAEIRRRLPNCRFANQPEPDGPYEFFSGPDIATLCNRARVGLCLSAAEGAMRASMEYLLCGLPVVTTPSEGGRDLFFDPAYAVTADPDPDAVARAVRELIGRRLEPEAVRRAVLARVRPMRQAFVDQLRELYERANRPWPPRGFFRDPFRHPYEDTFPVSTLPERILAADALQARALSTD